MEQGCFEPSGWILSLVLASVVIQAAATVLIGWLFWRVRMRAGIFLASASAALVISRLVQYRALVDGYGWTRTIQHTLFPLAVSVLFFAAGVVMLLDVLGVLTHSKAPAHDS